MHLRVHTVEADQFCEYKNHLSGLMTENIEEVHYRIAILGLNMQPVTDAATTLAGQVGIAADGGPGLV